jgi:hypothetical protein
MEQCKREEPPLVEIAPGHFAACFLHGEGVTSAAQ